MKHLLLFVALASAVFAQPTPVGGPAAASQSEVNAGAVSTKFVSPLTLKNYVPGTPGPGTFSSVTDTGLTSGRVTFASTGGLLADAAALTWDGTTLSATKFSGALNGTVGVTTPATGAFTTGIVNAAAGIAPSVEFEVDSTSTSSPRGIMSAQFNTGTDGARFHMRKARGTRTSPTVVVASDNLGRLVASGYDGSNYLEMASIIFGVPSGATVAATRVPTEITFQVGTNAAPSALTTTAAFSSTTGVALTALGTDQNVTLTASGAGIIKLGQSGSNPVVLGATSNNDAFRWDGSTFDLRLDSGGASVVNILRLGVVASSLNIRNGNTILGVNADSSNGRLQVLQSTLGSGVAALMSTATNDDPTEIVYQNRVATTDATVTTLHTFTIPASTTYMVEVRVQARRTGGTAGTAEDGAGYVRRATYKNAAGTATLIGSVQDDYTAESQAGWECTLDATGATARVRVTGAVDNNVTWHMTARVYPVSS